MIQKKTLKEILVEVLNIINFDGNKENFSNEFINLVHASTLAELVGLITTEKGAAFFDGVSAETKPQELHQMVIGEVGKEKFTEYFQKHATEKLKEYFSEISATISNEDKKKILNLILN